MTKNNNFESVNFKNLHLFDFNKIIHSWKLDFIQLEPGVFLGDLSQIIYEDLLISYGRFSTTIKQEGFSPEGVWTFAFINDAKIYWRNYKVQPNSIIIYAPGSEINAVSGANFEVMTFSVSDEFLFETAKKEGMEEFYNSLQSIDVVAPKSPLRIKLRKAIFSEINKQLKNPNYNNRTAFKESFTKKLLLLLKGSSVNMEKVSSKKRLKLLHDAEHYMTQHITEPITISNIASYLNVSERTLLYAFKNRFNMGPKAFMLVLKLNHSYHRLHKEKEIKSIAHIARDSGFWHMGQYYKDYKKFFGELPSQTLKNSSLNK